MKTLSAKAKISGLIKTIKWLLLFACFACSAQTDLRIVGTNLYDFTHAQTNFFFGGPNMRVVKVYPQSVQVQITRFHSQFIPDVQTYPSPFGIYPRSSPYDFSSSHGFLESMARDRAIQNPNLSAGAAYSMGISGHTELIATKPSIYLLHPPGGTQLDCFAVPSLNPRFWDCGVPFNGDRFDFKYIYRVTDKITCERQYSPKEIIETEMRQASNNVAYYQFKLSQRYFKGDGVQTNRELSLFWANQAASNSYPDAVKFITQFTNISDTMPK